MIDLRGAALVLLLLVPAFPAFQASKPPVRPAQFADVTAKSHIDFVHKS